MDLLKNNACLRTLRRILSGLLKTLAMLLALYLFICSLTFLSASFRILGGRNLSSLFSSSALLSNPVVGVVIGILVTVLVQSSATSTSIVVSLVSAGVSVRHTVPMILGSNVGTSVTNTIVSMTQAGDRERFRRAFAAATVHDMFNWLAVALMLLVEMSTGFLEKTTARLVDLMPLGTEVSSPDLLKPLTKPLTDRVVQLDKKVLIGWSMEDPAYENVTTLIRTRCGSSDDRVIQCTSLTAVLGPNGLGWSDTLIGVILLAFSLAMLCGCLLALMKVLNSVLSDKMATLIQKTINADIPCCPWLTGYIAMLVGAVITVLVRSSSVFTSTLTPLCGAGLVTLETAYPMTLGSNIGTTTTAILASLAAEGQYLQASVQIALVHLCFNVIGILIFYPVPWMRWPIPLARMLGDKTARYPWFAALYLVASFFVFPLVVFLLSLAGLAVMYAVLGSLAMVVVVILAINQVQERWPGMLPKRLRDWSFLPLWMRSLEPLDEAFSSLSCCVKCYGNVTEEPEYKPAFTVDISSSVDKATERPIIKANGHGPVFSEQLENGSLLQPDRSKDVEAAI